MVLLHIVGVGASLQLERFILILGAGPAASDVGLARKRMFPPEKLYANEPPARQTAAMIHGIQLWLCFGRLSVRGRSGICRPVPEKRADIPSLSAALTGGCNDSLAA